MPPGPGTSQPPSTALPVAAASECPDDARAVQQRIAGRAWLSAGPQTGRSRPHDSSPIDPGNSTGPGRPTAPPAGLRLLPAALLVGIGLTGWLGTRSPGSGWAGLVATVGCLLVARVWHLQEDWTAAVDERVRAGLAEAEPCAGPSAGPATDRTGPAAPTAAPTDPVADVKADPVAGVKADPVADVKADPAADDTAGRRIAHPGRPATAHPADPTADPAPSTDTDSCTGTDTDTHNDTHIDTHTDQATPRSLVPRLPPLAGVLATARAAVATAVDRLGVATTVQAGLFALALTLISVSAAAAFVARPGVLSLLAATGAPLLLGVHLRLLARRVRRPPVGTGPAARAVDVALAGHDLRVRLALGGAAPALYALTWQGLPSWWVGICVVAIGLLVVVQVLVLLRLQQDSATIGDIAPTVDRGSAP